MVHFFSMIDGKTTVKEIGEALSAQHEEASQQLYERLFLYLNHLESVERWIEIVEKGNSLLFLFDKNFS